MPQVSAYLNKKNLEKIDAARGKNIKRSTALNAIFDVLDEDWIKSLLK